MTCTPPRSRHPFTRRNNFAMLGAFAVIGGVLAFAIGDAQVGTYTFIAVTSVEAWAFTLFYGLMSTWRATAAARALFWVVLSYALLSSQVIAANVFEFRPSIAQDIRQVLYTALAVAGLNLFLTTIRLVLDDRGTAP